jgi:predicted metal-dependent phosphoesterase TrpH
MRFELHCHSTCSDGTERPEQIAARVAARNVDVFALTDHDTCAGFSAVATAAARVVRGVEISCDHEGRTIHVLAFDRGHPGWAALETRLDAVRTARVNRLRVMAARLAHRGIRIPIEDLIAAAGSRAVGRPDLARAMVAAKAALSMKDAFARHLYDGGPVDVPHHALPITEALELGQAANAAMSLAHPSLYDELSVHLVKRYRGAGLTGIEAFAGAYDSRERERWVAVADKHDLVCTGGSDWHGPEDAQAQPGIDLPKARGEDLLAWLG